MKAELFAFRAIAPVGHPENSGSTPIVGYAGPLADQFVTDPAQARLETAGFWQRKAAWKNFEQAGYIAELVAAAEIGR